MWVLFHVYSLRLTLKLWLIIRGALLKQRKHVKGKNDFDQNFDHAPFRTTLGIKLQRNLQKLHIHSTFSQRIKYRYFRPRSRPRSFPFSSCMSTGLTGKYITRHRTYFPFVSNSADLVNNFHFGFNSVTQHQLTVHSFWMLFCYYFVSNAPLQLHYLQFFDLILFYEMIRYRYAFKNSFLINVSNGKIDQKTFSSISYAHWWSFSVNFPFWYVKKKTLFKLISQFQMLFHILYPYVKQKKRYYDDLFKK